MAQQYNGNGSWTYVPDTNTDRREPVSTTGGSSTNSSPTITDTSNKDTTEATNTATKEYIDVEDNILVGDMTVLPNPYYKAKTTALLQYLGINLTGLYFVDKVTHVFGSSGYEQSITVSRNGFGNTIKSGSASKPIDKVVNTTGNLNTTRPTAPVVVTPPVSARYYTIKSGDTLWAIATKYYGSGAQYTKIFNANKNIISNANLIYPGQKILIP